MGESACRLRVAAEMPASCVESNLVLDEASACVGTLHHLLPLLLKFTCFVRRRRSSGSAEDCCVWAVVPRTFICAQSVDDTVEKTMTRDPSANSTRLNGSSMSVVEPTADNTRPRGTQNSVILWASLPIMRRHETPQRVRQTRWVPSTLCTTQTTCLVNWATIHRFAPRGGQESVRWASATDPPLLFSRFLRQQRQSLRVVQAV